MEPSIQNQEKDRVAITLKRSPVGRSTKQRKFLRSLGLTRLHQSVEHPRTPQVLGLIDKVKHLIEVTSS